MTRYTVTFPGMGPQFFTSKADVDRHITSTRALMRMDKYGKRLVGVRPPWPQVVETPD